MKKFTIRAMMLTVVVVAIILALVERLPVGDDSEFIRCEYRDRVPILDTIPSK